MRHLLLCLALAFLFACQSAPKAISDRGDLGRTLILISLDGFRADYLDLYPAPHLMELAQRGLRAKGMISAFPSLTFPNHYTIVTGLRPDEHGIVANDMRDPHIPETFKLSDAKAVDDPRWWGGEPLWVSAEKQGIRAGTVFWPGSSAVIMGVRPSFWLPYDKSMPRSERVAKLLSWLDLPKGQRPSFCTLYLEDVDTQGHAHGPLSPEVKKAVADVDQTVGELTDALKSRAILNQVDIIVLADHGMAEVSDEHVIKLSSLAPAGEYESVGGGALVGIYPVPGRDPDANAGLETRLLRAFKSSPHFRTYKKADVPARFHYSHHPRIAPLVAIADEGWYLTAGFNNSHPKGAHGYDPRSPQMQALFIAAGPSFKPGQRMPSFENIDVYDLMAHALGIKPAPNEGTLETFRTYLNP